MHLLEFAGDDDELAALEASTAAAAVDQLGPGLATARGLRTDRVGGLAFTRWASELVGQSDASIEGARATLSAAPIDRSGSVAVRARTVRDSAPVSTQRAERVLGQVLVDRGFTVDLESPDHVLRAIFTADGDRGVGALGWLAAASVRDFGDRAPTAKPYFAPGSMDPQLGRAVANLAGAAPDRHILDPMCGTGGVLVEAGLVGANVFGGDVQREMIRGTRRNLEQYLEEATGPTGAPPGNWALLQADAGRLPLVDDAVDGIVVDVPYGRQSPVIGGEGDLVSRVLAECHRLAPRAVVVADRSLADQARAQGWTVEAALKRYVHRSLERHVLVCERA